MEFPKGIRKDILKRSKSTFSVSQLPFQAKLDQNESCFELPENIKAFLTEELNKLEWRRYPQANLYRKAKQALSEYLNISPDEVIITSGGDQVIQGVFIITNPKTLIFEPTYPMYRLFALHSKKKTKIEILSPEYEIDTDFFNEYFDLVNIVTPNNPTGNIQKNSVINSALKKAGAVLIDEAYHEFSGITYIDLIRKFNNLFITRTFSKTFSISGLRIGYGISVKENIRILENIMFSPYNVNILSLLICINIQKLLPHIRKVNKFIQKEKEKFYSQFDKLKINYLKSCGNFISFSCDSKLYKYLIEKGVRVRNLSPIPGMNGYLRVSIGAAEENNLFINELHKYLHK
ncbi:MAG: histidinol-phosphate transaminase [bacterium]|nr:histidinol-phosphate transaminase [bacterium]